MATSSLLRSFVGLAAEQVLGAVADNFFKMAVSLFAVQALPDTGASSYLSLTGVLIAAPYLILSGLAGYLADRLSKRTVLAVLKLAEIAIVAAGLIVLAQLQSQKASSPSLRFSPANPPRVSNRQRSESC